MTMYEVVFMLDIVLLRYLYYCGLLLFVTKENSNVFVVKNSGFVDEQTVFKMFIVCSVNG